MCFRLYSVLGQIHYLPIYHYTEHLFACQDFFENVSQYSYTEKLIFCSDLFSEAATEIDAVCKKTDKTPNEIVQTVSVLSFGA